MHHYEREGEEGQHPVQLLVREERQARQPVPAQSQPVLRHTTSGLSQQHSMSASHSNGRSSPLLLTVIQHSSRVTRHKQGVTSHGPPPYLELVPVAPKLHKLACGDAEQGASEARRVSSANRDRPRSRAAVVLASGRALHAPVCLPGPVVSVC